MMHDYTNSQRFVKGHLLPSSYRLTEEEEKSTFTLTNIVPQEATFNKGSWKRMESCVRCVLDKYCINNNNKKEAFVVTGAQPSDGGLLNKKINIPSMLWSAFCCYSSSQNRWLAGAHWGKNVPEINKEYLQTKTLAELFSKLGVQFNVFPGARCPLGTTVSEFYPRLKKDCECPPPDLSTTAPPTTASTELTMTSGPHSTTSGLSTTKSSHSATSSPFSTSTGILTTTPDSPSVSTAYHIISSQSLPPPLTISPTKIPPTPTLCDPLVYFFHYYQSILTYYQWLHQYQGRTYHTIKYPLDQIKNYMETHCPPKK
ncbi:uncharacterized protein LOC121639557 [Melanotaenia boesemani]|uniref:uncharacterized protein LOC121639557 n=1 Tax=Melanotaenia boesemani TaxID=1250792 RepID=UPI001C0444A5|nr:uncharacterized protein LOC121639557 [Melanotaenia boesemani]